MKAVKVIHMREVFAEFLGTFLLTVSYYLCIITYVLRNLSICTISKLRSAN